VTLDDSDRFCNGGGGTGGVREAKDVTVVVGVTVIVVGSDIGNEMIAMTTLTTSAFGTPSSCHRHFKN